MRNWAWVLVAAVPAAGCGQTGSTADAAVHETISVCSNGVRIGVLQDKSRSTTPNGVYQIVPDDLRTIVDVVVRCGGELGLGIVGEPSGAPLLRWAVPAPAPAPAPPLPNQSSINAAIARSEYEERRANWEAEEQTREMRARQRFETFLGRATSMLSTKPNDPTTPLWLAMARADAFLGEPDITLPSHRYMVLSSDGINTAGEPIALTSNATLFVANGSQAIGSLSKLQLTVVENPVGAFRKIIEEETSHDRN